MMYYILVFWFLFVFSVVYVKHFVLLLCFSIEQYGSSFWCSYRGCIIACLSSSLRTNLDHEVLFVIRMILNMSIYFCRYTVSYFLWQLPAPLGRLSPSSTTSCRPSTARRKHLKPTLINTSPLCLSTGEISSVTLSGLPTSKGRVSMKICLLAAGFLATWRSACGAGSAFNFWSRVRRTRCVQFILLIFDQQGERAG